MPLTGFSLLRSDQAKCSNLRSRFKNVGFDGHGFVFSAAKRSS
jgi:hypothetical protein